MVATVRVTQEGYERLKATLQQEYGRLEEATNILREQIGSSDDYDDTGLEEAKREKARIEQRIDNLEDQLERAEIIEGGALDHVDLGATVTLQDVDTKEDVQVQVVAPIEAGVLEGDIPRVSDESPLGKALMGREAGETFDVKIGGSKTTYTIVSIE